MAATSVSAQNAEIVQWIWDEKYRLKRPDGTVVDKTIDDTWNRVAGALSEPDASDPSFKGDLMEEMASLRFLPAGRIIAGAGSGRDVTLMNCYVMGPIEDSLIGINNAVGEAAMTLKTGGGIGMDFSTLRPRGAPVGGVESTSSGTVSFMSMWDAMCGTIMSAGTRRGAMMGILRCDHPDIEEFIDAKKTAGRLTNFNVSIAVTEEFMDAVRDRRKWHLAFCGKNYKDKVVDAAELWEKILRSTYDYAEPGVIFIDRMNKLNPLQSIEQFAATNPCGEQPLPPYGACCLGSINLPQLVSNGTINMNRLRKTTSIAIQALDNAITISKYPLAQQREEAHNKRRVGLGVTGLADALIMLGIRYGSKAAVNVTSRLMAQIRNEAENTTARLGRDKGNFPLFEPTTFVFGAEARSSVYRRNSHVLSIAPTGTISMLAGNVSSGIEPVFAWDASRKILEADGSHRTMLVQDYAASLVTERDGDEWVTADELTPVEHIDMVAAVQPYVDSAISKTINCPATMTFEEFGDVYDYAYSKGLKGCTTYRPSGVRGAVLEKIDTSEPASSGQKKDGNVVAIAPLLQRDEVLEGKTYKVKAGDHALYITINDIVVDGRRRPFELFLASKDVDGSAWRVALSRMISAIFRKGGDISFVAEELKAVFDPRGGFWAGGEYVVSACAAIGSVIERHLRDGGIAVPVQAETQARHCPKCQTGSLVMQEGCASCMSCGYSKC